MTTHLTTLLESHRATTTTLKWRVWRQILPLLAGVMMSGHANAHYIDSDFSGEIEIYRGIGFNHHWQTLTSDLMVPVACHSLKIKSGIWEVFYSGGTTPSCVLRDPADYDRLDLPQLNCDDSSHPVILNNCTGFRLRRDIMRQVANKKYDTWVINEIQNQLNPVVTKTIEIEATIAAKLAAIEISEDDKQEILTEVKGALQPTIDELRQTLTDEITTSIFDKLKAEGVVEE